MSSLSKVLTNARYIKMYKGDAISKLASRFVHEIDIKRKENCVSKAHPFGFQALLKMHYLKLWLNNKLSRFKAVYIYIIIKLISLTFFHGYRT